MGISRGIVDDRRYRHVAQRFDEHVFQAERWCETLCVYFYEKSEIPDAHGRVPTSE